MRHYDGVVDEKTQPTNLGSTRSQEKALHIGKPTVMQVRSAKETLVRNQFLLIRQHLACDRKNPIYGHSLENEKTQTKKKEFDLVLNNTVLIFLIFII
jgi:hypothetical protein